MRRCRAVESTVVRMVLLGRDEREREERSNLLVRHIIANDEIDS